MLTIALVDDDRNILTSVSIALEAEGYKVETYTDGASALDGLLARLSSPTPRFAQTDVRIHAEVLASLLSVIALNNRECRL